MHTLILISLISGAYVFIRSVIPLNIRWWWKLTLGLLLFAAVCCFEGLKLLGGGRMFAPDLPAWVILGYTWLYLVVMAFFFLILGAQVVRWLLLLCPRWRMQSKSTRQSVFNRVHAALMIVAAILCSVGMYNAMALPDVKEVHFRADTPLRIVMLTDLHADAVKGAEYIRNIVERVNALQPDAVVITGDFVDGSVALRRHHLEPLRGIKAPLGVYGVPGNHDYFSGYEAWMACFRSMGIRMLLNEHVVLGEPGLVLAGVTDPAAQAFGLEPPCVEKALAGAPTGRPVMLLAHQPQVAVSAAADDRVDFQLSGHTHGGLIPGFVQLTARYNCGWVSGLYQVGRMQLYVSNGTSLWTGLPVRLGVPSEITLITLHP